MPVLEYDLLIEDANLDFVRIHYNPEGILELHYKNDIELTMEHVSELTRYGNDIKNKTNEKYGVLSILSEGFSTTLEVQKYGTSKDANVNNYATAVVLDTFAHRLIANFIVRIQKPPVPHKHFKTFKEAESWLLKVRSEQEV